MKIIAITEINVDRGQLDIGQYYLDKNINGKSVLEHTLCRLLNAKKIERACINIIGSHQERRNHIQAIATKLDIKTYNIDLPDTRIRKLVLAGRKWALESWRGGVHNALWYDEFGVPSNIHRITKEEHADITALIPPGALFLDPQLLDEQIAHLIENSAETTMCFTQSPPGLSGIVYKIDIVDLLARTNLPLMPAFEMDIQTSAKDYILSPANKQVEREIRMCKGRFIADTRRSFEFIERIAAELPDMENSTALQVAQVANNHPEWKNPILPHEIEIEITGRNNLKTIDYSNHLTPRQETDMPLDTFIKILDQLTPYDDTCISLGGFGEPLLHPQVFEMLKIAREKKMFGVHLATNGILLDEKALEKIIDADPDIVTISLGAHSKETYADVKGADHYELVKGNIERALTVPKYVELGVPFFIPEIVKIRRVESEIEPFVDYWFPKVKWVLIRGYNYYCGQVEDRSVIHLTLSHRTLCRKIASKLTILSNGDIPYCDEDLFGKYPIGNINHDKIEDIWQKGKIESLRQAQIADRFDSFDLCKKCLDWDKV